MLSDDQGLFSLIDLLMDQIKPAEAKNLSIHKPCLLSISLEKSLLSIVDHEPCND